MENATKYKVDLVMWTKNGMKTLPYVLKRIEQVIPEDTVCQKIIVDDKSQDDTPKIANQFGWTVIPNEKSGISSGANTALKHVTSDFFVSFEQDLFLAADWWNKVTPLMENPKTAAASGLRFANKPLAVAKHDEYEAEKFRLKTKSNDFDPAEEGGLIGKTLDNTIYKTKVLKEIGGFPVLPTVSGVDAVLAHRLWRFGYQWAVTFDVKSVHIRLGGLREELRHCYRCAKEAKKVSKALACETGYSDGLSEQRVIYRFLVSPVSAFRVALKTKEPTIIIVYPLIKMCYVKGTLKST